MRAVISFDLPEEGAEHRLALNGGKYFSALCDFKEALRTAQQPTADDICFMWEQAVADIDWNEIP